MKKLTGAILAVLMILSLCACGQSAPTWQEQYDLGIKYLEEGNYEEAVLAFTAAIEIDPKQPDAYIGLADAYVGEGDPDAAKKALEDGLAACGEDDPALIAKIEELSSAPGNDAENEYDENGNLVRSTHRSQDGAYWTSEYDAAGNVVQTTYYNADGTLSTYYTLEYDAEGNLARRTRYDADGIVMYIDEYGAENVVRQTWYEADGMVKFYHIKERDAEGNVVRSTTYNADGTLR